MQMNAAIDVKHVLPAIQVPTLVIRRKDDLTVIVEAGRYLVIGGKTVDTIGNGVSATFDDPTHANRYAVECGESLEQFGLKIRAGLHSGDCELLDNKVSGMAVPVGTRVVKEVRPVEDLVSSAVKDLVAGSKIGFTEREAV
jgi:class 3 adenylate cyclase